MHIREVTITVGDVDVAATFFGEVLELPVVSRGLGPAMEVTAGWSRLILTSGTQDTGAHHLAFEVGKDRFTDVASWLRSRCDTISVDGSDVVSGPPGWKSQSVYFSGPEGMVLEIIARQDTHQVPGDRFLGISEIGLGVTHVSAACETVIDAMGISEYHFSSPTFAPLGDHRGLLIVVDRDRTWFPTQTSLPARGSLTALLNNELGFLSD